MPESSIKSNWPRALVALALFREFRMSDTYSYPCVQSRYLVWGVTGYGKIIVNGTTYEMHPMRYLVVPWNHSITYIPSLEHPYTLGCIHIIPEAEPLEEAKLDIFHKPTPQDILYFRRHNVPLEGYEQTVAMTMTADSPLLQLSNYVVRQFIRQANMDQLQLYARLLLYELCSLRPEEPGHDGLPSAHDGIPPALNHMLIYIQDYLEMPINAKGLMFHSQLSMPSIYRLFRRYLNTTPQRYIMEQRLLHAARILMQTTIRIVELAGNLQFATAAHFSNAFKRHFGMSPKQWREKASQQSYSPLPFPRSHLTEDIVPLNPVFHPKDIPLEQRREPPMRR